MSTVCRFEPLFDVLAARSRRFAERLAVRSRWGTRTRRRGPGKLLPWTCDRSIYDRLTLRLSACSICIDRASITEIRQSDDLSEAHIAHTISQGPRHLYRGRNGAKALREAVSCSNVATLPVAEGQLGRPNPRCAQGPHEFPHHSANFRGRSTHRRMHRNL